MDMETKNIIRELRIKSGMSQQELADRLYVTRQAVSRWENGNTVPDTETLIKISEIFDISVNTLLGSPRKLICQCCGMPLEENYISRNSDGLFNENYCKWCFKDGKFIYTDIEKLLDYLSEHIPVENMSSEQKRNHFREHLENLDYWKNQSK